MSQLFASGGQSIGSASALVLLKSKDITLPTKVHLVKAMVFPVVMYGYESWTIKKAESQRIDAFKVWGWRRLLRVPWTARRSKHSILRETNPEYSLEGLMLKLKLQYSGHLMWRADSLEKTPMLGKIKGRRRRGQQRRRWLDGITNSMAKLLEIITVKPCMLQSMGLQRTKHNLETEQPQGKQSISGHLNTATLSLCCFMKERTETCWEFPGCPVVKTSPSYTVGVGSIPGQEAKIPHTSWPKNQNIKQKQCCNKLNKDNKNGPH